MNGVVPLKYQINIITEVASHLYYSICMVKRVAPFEEIYSAFYQDLIS